MSAPYAIDVISADHLIADHTFAFIQRGTMHLYDGSRDYVLKSGQGGMARKNRFARFKKQKVDGQLEKVFVFFDEAFLHRFQDKYAVEPLTMDSLDTVVPLKSNPLVARFVESLRPHYDHGTILNGLTDAKREELLLLLLNDQPELSGMLFDFRPPDKINLEEFMNRNYTFHVSLERFAYLTGRSLSAFKRDFAQVFHQTPGRWLVQKRLEEAHFQMSQNHRAPSDIYLDLGFENFSHFSFAFKKRFGRNPSEVGK